MGMSEKQEKIYSVTTDLRSFRAARAILFDVVPPPEDDPDREKYQEMYRLLVQLEESYAKKLRKLTN